MSEPIDPNRPDGGGGEIPTPAPETPTGATPPPASADPGYIPPATPAPVSYESGVIEMNKDARMWGMLCHLAGLCALMGIPSIVGPLVIWLIKKNDYEFVDDQGKEAVNFHLTMLFATIVSLVLVCVGIGFFLLAAVAIVAVIFAILGAVQANNGVRYRYPLTLRLIT